MISLILDPLLFATGRSSGPAAHDARAAACYGLRAHACSVLCSCWEPAWTVKPPTLPTPPTLQPPPPSPTRTQTHILACRWRAGVRGGHGAGLAGAPRRSALVRPRCARCAALHVPRALCCRTGPTCRTSLPSAGVAAAPACWSGTHHPAVCSACTRLTHPSDTASASSAH